MNDPISQSPNDPISQSPNDSAGNMSNDGSAAPTVIETKNEATSQGKRASRYRVAIIASVVFHVLLVFVLLFWYLPKLYKPTPNAVTAASNDDGASSGTTQQATPETTANVPDELIEASVQMQIDQSESMSDEEKLTELEKNLKRLESIASPKSVEAISQKVGSTLGLDTQQYQPKKDAAAGEFDVGTAQMTDVSRVKNAAGNWEYQAVMVDAQGRTMDVPITAQDGESLYQVFQNIKKFPMAAGIYRSVVMPMVQKIIQAQDAAQKTAKEAERMNQQKAP